MVSVIPQKLPDVRMIVPQRVEDSRGYFTETYNFAQFARDGLDNTFVQDNQSLSIKAGTIRGLHFQTPPHAQAKLIRVLRGSVFDVAVDLRARSTTFGQWCGATLTASEGEQLFLPKGFAHGFCTLEAETIVAYKVDEYYAPGHESGLRWDDPDLAIAWPINASDIICSAKDEALPSFRDVTSPFV